MNSIRHTQEPLQLWLCRLRRKKFRSDLQLLHPWATFSGDVHASLPKQPGAHIHGRLHHSCPQAANTTFATPMATISYSHIQQCLNRNTAHFAQAFSCQNSLSTPELFLYIFPSNETCNINVNPLFHAAIKNYHKNLTASSFFSLLFFQQHLARK